MKRGLGVLIIGFLMVAGCQSRPPAPRPVTVPPGMDRFLMVSFINVAQVVGVDQGVRSPLSGQVFVTGEVDAAAERFLTGVAMEHLQDRLSVKLISPSQARNLRSMPLAISNPDVSERELLLETGRKLSADGVFVGHVYRYRNRVGGKYSVDAPASVAFDIFLLRVSDGRILWSRFYDETQKALTDDLFQLGAFLDRDGQWVTADQMARAALDRMMETLKIP
jgi:hypothetical protein